jgi:mRNA interferase RelE/StbE
MELVIAAEAARSLRKNVPRREAAVIMERMAEIAENPYAPRGGVKPLVGQPHHFRLRVGEWRAIYRVDAAVVMVYLLRVANRKEAYR